jgi:hypothetical protein
MIAERIRQHKDFVSKDDKNKVPKAKVWLEAVNELY